MGRPRKYANAAEKQAAFRERYSIKSIRFEAHTAESIKQIAEFFEVSDAEVINSMVKFALTNRNWINQGLWGKPLPRANPFED